VSTFPSCLDLSIHALRKSSNVCSSEQTLPLDAATMKYLWDR
jgi:hypothetical protein